jgi:hypothetical protein
LQTARIYSYSRRPRASVCTNSADATHAALRSILVGRARLHPSGLIVFRLVPISMQSEEPEAGEHAKLRRAAYTAISTPSHPPKDARRGFYERSPAVRAYVLSRSRGGCEACGREAPFRRKDGSPYLEPHHAHRVADGGPDHPAWVGALCRLVIGKYATARMAHLSTRAFGAA